MGKRRFFCILAFSVLSFILDDAAFAQFKSEAFTQQYNEEGQGKGKNGKDSTDVMFSFKEYFAGLSHKKELKIGTSFAGSALIIGGQQIYNKQAWKLPIVYGGIGAGVAGGIYFNSQGNTKASTWCYVGAGAVYWATLMDGVLSYKPSEYPHAGKATIFSILLPGLGQIYNNEWWKLPIYLGGMGFAFHLYLDNRQNYLRFQRIYREATDPEVQYSGPVTADQALYYRNVYRRYRDYSLLAVFGVYILQIIDANVFSYMHNFDVDDDLALKISPAVIMPENQLASTFSPGPAFGMRLGFTF